MKNPIGYNVKYELDFIRNQFKNENYTLLSEEYINCNQKLDFVCPNGHYHSISWNNWLHKKRRCAYCDGQGKPTIEFIKKEFEKDGYILLTSKYYNARKKLDYICSLGHKHSMEWFSWKKGARCPTCKAIKMSGAGHQNWKGGISFEPYCHIWLDRDFKDDIKRRDNYECQNIFCEGKYTRLCVHHIDYNKKECHPMNLITLCNSCNSKANFDRGWHEAFYKEIMKRKLAVLKNSQ